MREVVNADTVLVWVADVQQLGFEIGELTALPASFDVRGLELLRVDQGGVRRY